MASSDPYAPYGGGGSGTSSGGSTGPYGNIGSGGSGGGTTAKKPRQAPRPKDAIVRLAARLNKVRTNPKNTNPKNYQAAVAEADTIRRSLTSAFADYSPEDIQRVGKRANLPDAEISGLINAVGAKQNAAPTGRHVAAAASTALDILGRPQQAVLGGITEAASGNNPGFGGAFKGFLSGAEKGLTGEQRYTPTESALRVVGGESRAQAAKSAAKLSPFLRVPGDIAGSVLTDPTTYLTFGTTAGTEAATRTAAPIVAALREPAQAAEIARVADLGTLTSNPAIKGVLEQLGTRGIKALTKPERVAVRAQSGRGVIQGLKGAQGGIKALGRTVPGTPLLEQPGAALSRRVALHQLGQSGLDPTNLAQVERLTRTLGGLRQAERAGLVPKGAVKDTETLFRNTIEGARARSVMQGREAARLTAGLDDAALARVQRSLDVGGGGPEAIAALPSEAERTAAQGLRDLLNTAGEKQVGAGLLQPEEALAGVEHVPPEQYYPRFPLPNKSGAAPGQGAPFSARLSPNLQAREGSTRFVPTADIPANPLGGGGPKYELHPGIATARRVALAERDVARVNFVRGMQDLGFVEPNIPPELQRAIDAGRITEYGNSVVKKLPVTTTNPATGEIAVGSQHVLVNKIVASDFDRVVKLITDDSARAWAKNAWDHWMGLWKGYATTFGPFGGGFALRNAEGNLVNGFWLTNTSPSWLVRAGRIQQKMWRGGRAGDIYKFLTPEEAGLVRQAYDTGAIDSGFFKVDLGDPASFQKSVEDTFKSAGVNRLNPLSQQNLLLDYGRRFNQAIERNARFGLFLGQRAKGLNPNEASRIVQKYLFDYNELSTADRAIKQVVPFFTWTRKNIPLQLETLFKTPYKITTQAHVLDALRQIGQPYPNADVPQFIQQGEGVNLPEKVGGNVAAFTPDLPFTSTYKDLAPLQDLLAPLLHGRVPLTGDPQGFQNLVSDTYNAAQLGGPAGGTLAGLIQAAAGRNVFSGRPFAPGEQVPTPNPLAQIPGAPSTIPAGAQFLAEQLFPGLAKVRGVFPTDKGGIDRETLNRISTFLGQKIYPLTKRTARAEAYRRLEILQALQKYLSGRNVAVPVSTPKKSTAASSSNPYGG